MAAAETPVQEVRAQAKWVRLSPRKARVVLEHIRGRTVPEARTVLAFTPRAAAREIDKVLRSAVANAEANHGFVGDDMVVAAAYADEGPVLKRWQPRARGRAGRIHKPTCHITIKLAPAAERPVGGSGPAEGAREDREGAPARAATSKQPEKTVEEPTAEEKAEARRGRSPKTKETEA